MLIGVEIHSPVFLELNKPQPIVLSELAEGLVTEDTPELGETRRVSP